MRFLILLLLLPISIGCDSEPEIKMIPEYNLEYKGSSGIEVGVIDSFVYIDRERANNKTSKVIIDILRYSLDNNKIFVAADSQKVRGVLPLNIMKEKAFFGLKRNINRVKGDSAQVSYSLIHADSILLYQSFYDINSGGFILFEKKQNSFY